MRQAAEAMYRRRGRRIWDQAPTRVMASNVFRRDQLAGSIQWRPRQRPQPSPAHSNKFGHSSDQNLILYIYEVIFKPET